MTHEQALDIERALERRDALKRQIAQVQIASKDTDMLLRALETELKYVNCKIMAPETARKMEERIADH